MNDITKEKWKRVNSTQITDEQNRVVAEVGQSYGADRTNACIPLPRASRIDHIHKVPSFANAISAIPELIKEHEQWANCFGEALVLALQDNYLAIDRLKNDMKIDYENGKPVLYSPALQKVNGKG